MLVGGLPSPLSPPEAPAVHPLASASAAAGAPAAESTPPSARQATQAAPALRSAPTAAEEPVGPAGPGQPPRLTIHPPPAVPPLPLTVPTPAPASAARPPPPAILAALPPPGGSVAAPAPPGPPRVLASPQAQPPPPAPAPNSSAGLPALPTGVAGAGVDTALLGTVTPALLARLGALVPLLRSLTGPIQFPPAGHPAAFAPPEPPLPTPPPRGVVGATHQIQPPPSQPSPVQPPAGRFAIGASPLSLVPPAAVPAVPTSSAEPRVPWPPDSTPSPAAAQPAAPAIPPRPLLPVGTAAAAFSLAGGHPSTTTSYAASAAAAARRAAAAAAAATFPSAPSHACVLPSLSATPQPPAASLRVVSPPATASPPPSPHTPTGARNIGDGGCSSPTTSPAPGRRGARDRETAVPAAAGLEGARAAVPARPGPIASGEQKRRDDHATSKRRDGGDNERDDEANRMLRTVADSMQLSVSCPASILLLCGRRARCTTAIVAVGTAFSWVHVTPFCALSPSRFSRARSSRKSCARSSMTPRRRATAALPATTPPPTTETPDAPPLPLAPHSRPLVAQARRFDRRGSQLAAEQARLQAGEEASGGMSSLLLAHQRASTGDASEGRKHVLHNGGARRRRLCMHSGVFASVRLI